MQLNLGSPCLAPIALLATDWHNRKRAHTHTSSMVCYSPSVLRVSATLKSCCWLGLTGYAPLDKTPIYVPVTVLITILERSWLMMRIHSYNDVIVVAASSGDLRLSRLPCWSSLSLASIVTSWPHLLFSDTATVLINRVQCTKVHQTLRHPINTDVYKTLVSRRGPKHDYITSCDSMFL